MARIDDEPFEVPLEVLPHDSVRAPEAQVLPGLGHDVGQDHPVDAQALEPRDRRALLRLRLREQRIDLPERSRLRSEEHTSELQSLRHLVCRLLLEKKKNTE